MTIGYADHGGIGVSGVRDPVELAGFESLNNCMRSCFVDGLI